MATRIDIRVRADEALDLEPRPQWRESSSSPHRDELHVSIGPLRLVMTEVVAVTLAQQLEALVKGKQEEDRS